MTVARVLTAAPIAEERVEPISGVLQHLAQQNQLVGANNPLLQRTEGLLRAVSMKPRRMYRHSGTEFFHPQLSLVELLQIGSAHKGENYQSVAASISNSGESFDYSAIYLHKYTDQADPIYDEMLRKFPEQERKPYHEDRKAKYFPFRRWLQNSGKDLAQRREEQLRVIQKIVDHIMRLHDPGVERIFLPTPEEHHSKYGCPLQQAALCDAIFIVHREVPVEEQRGAEAYRRQHEEEMAQIDGLRGEEEYQRRLLLDRSEPEEALVAPALQPADPSPNGARHSHSYE